eukprot:XP_001692762.1 predicted protein [Chlamydomonas reinhardtii]
MTENEFVVRFSHRRYPARPDQPPLRQGSFGVGGAGGGEEFGLGAEERVEVLEDADDAGSVVAVLTVSLVAEAALATLRETMRHRGGGGGVPY